ncbi:DegT/DnrJ/EryC1/StrS family aminotransferase [Chryseobacterium phocaeense]|uniref:DegT/DnrJ/EryC1/StrS family aminotransferase n=1 Tax=Chryseobacterium phocaeense TaxID=1816690 RepID=UPI001E6381A3|nr:aminotransferase class I/II-fold pyridoxal phosphate-dependent enzyme [Chryseobacterium phocaeense]
MKKEKIWLSPPHMGGNELRYVHQALDTNWISQYGSNIDEFENSLENYFGSSSHVTALSSGTAAIHLALRMLNVEKGDFVICQSFTFVATANPVLYLNAVPVFVDSESQTWNMCPEALEDAVKYCIQQGKKPKAIIVVLSYGMPFMVEEIFQISKKYEIPVIEDSAEALGSRYKDRLCGTFGDFSVISFNGNKIITTGGGGALISRNAEDKVRALFLSTQAKDDMEFYGHSEIGYNYRMDNVAAGIGRGQMDTLEEKIMQRRQNHDFYQEAVKNIEDIELFSEPDSNFFSNYWLNTIILKNGLSKENLKARFSQENIETRYLWKPMHLQPLFQGYKFFGNNLSGTLFETGLCLPSGTNLTDEHRSRISEVLQSKIH